MHRIMEAVSGLRAAIAGAADANPVFLSTADKRAAILELVRVKSQVAELLLRIEAAASDVADEECARDVGAMLVASGAYDPVHARREYRLSQALERWEVVRAGLAAGAFTEEHAEVIVRALDGLPEEATDEDVVLAEKQLCEWAETFTPSQLRRLGRTILTVIDPEAGEAAEARALLRLEQDAADRARLSIRQMGDGTTRIQALVPDAIGVRLKTLLESFTQPRVAALNAEGLRVRNDKLMAEALGEMLERIDPRRFPSTAGSPPAWWSPSAWSSCDARSGWLSWSAPTPCCRPPRRAGSRARPGSSRWSWAATAGSWTSVARSGCSARRSARRCGCGTRPAAPRAARCRRPGATPTTSRRGAEAG